MNKVAFRPMIALSTDVLFLIIHTSAYVRAINDAATRMRKKLFEKNEKETVDKWDKVKYFSTSPENKLGTRIFRRRTRCLKKRLSTATCWSFLDKCCNEFSGRSKISKKNAFDSYRFHRRINILFSYSGAMKKYKYFLSGTLSRSF